MYSYEYAGNAMRQAADREQERRTNAMQTKTIAQLEDESNAADAAHERAKCRVDALSEAIRHLDALDSLSREEFLTDADRAALTTMNFAGAWLKLKAQAETARAEVNRLEDAALDAQRALNDAPEEAA